MKWLIENVQKWQMYEKLWPKLKINFIVNNYYDHSHTIHLKIITIRHWNNNGFNHFEYVRNESIHTQFLIWLTGILSELFKLINLLHSIHTRSQCLGWFWRGFRFSFLLFFFFLERNGSCFHKYRQND